MSNLSNAFISMISIAGVTMSILLSACTGATKLLPHSVYYRYGAGSDLQVWRMETDGLTTTQLTDEEYGVDDFAVSTMDGSLAFISNNQLFLLDNGSENRRLIVDGRQVDKGIEDYADRGFVGSPVFSPDGKMLAYGFDGLHLYDVATGQDEHLLTNLENLLGEPYVFLKENYVPGPWSPDGSQLLIIMFYMEGDTLAVMELGEVEPFRRLWSEGPVCCTYHWTHDGKSVLVANPSYGVHWPGLWRYDSRTGEKFDLVTTLPDSSHFVGWPVQLPSGELFYFYGERFSLDDGIPLVLVRSGSDGTDRIQIRSEEFHIIDVLWAEDGSFALVLQAVGPNLLESNSMQVILVRPDESPLQLLIEGERIWDLAWGP